MKVSIPPSGRIIACVYGALSYFSSSSFRLVDFLSCGGLVMSGSDEVESARGGRGGSGIGGLKNPGCGGGIASVFDAFEGVPTCIYRANFNQL